MTRVMLVYPKDIAETYYAKRPVMGIAYVGTALHVKNHLVELLDMRIKGCDLDYFRERLKEFRPDFVGFSIAALSLEQAYAMMDIVKKETSAKIVAGGPEVTLVPKKILSNPNVDFVFAGEGEISFREFLECHENGKDYSKISGLGFKKNGSLHFNNPKPIEDLDSLPFPDWDLFPLKKYKKTPDKIKFPILTSRGCPYSCKFCDSSVINGVYRARSPKNVADELEQVHKKYGNRNFQIMDDNFAVYNKRAIAICDEIINRKLGITWVVGQGFSPSKGSYELFKKMYDAGCRVVYFGIESADDEVLRAINKPHTVAQVRAAVKAAKAAGLIVKAPFISGLPKSNYEKEKKYIDFFKELDIDMPKMGQLIPFPGTEMYEWVMKNAKPLMDVDKIHEKASQTRGALDTDLFKPAFETDDFKVAERVKILKEFQNESEKWILQKTFGRFFGIIAFYFSRNRRIRALGVKFLDAYYGQY